MTVCVSGCVNVCDFFGREPTNPIALVDGFTVKADGLSQAWNGCSL